MSDAHPMYRMARQMLEPHGHYGIRIGGDLWRAPPPPWWKRQTYDVPNLMLNCTWTTSTNRMPPDA